MTGVIPSAPLPENGTNLIVNSGQSSPDLEVAALFSANGSHSTRIQQLPRQTGNKFIATVTSSIKNETVYQSLHVLAGNGDCKRTKEMLCNGANINCLDELGYTPAAWAADQRQLPMLELLAENGADLNLAGETGGQPLSLAANKGYIDVCRSLLEYGCDVDGTNAVGATALMYAAFNGHHLVAKLLLENGADMTLTDTNGKTAMDIAASKGHKKVIAVMEEYLASILAHSYDAKPSS